MTGPTLQGVSRAMALIHYTALCDCVCVGERDRERASHSLQSHTHSLSLSLSLTHMQCDVRAMALIQYKDWPNGYNNWVFMNKLSVVTFFITPDIITLDIITLDIITLGIITITGSS